MKDCQVKRDQHLKEKLEAKAEKDALEKEMKKLVDILKKLEFDYMEADAAAKEPERLMNAQQQTMERRTNELSRERTRMLNLDK